ncbi:MAG: hypothetical protein SH848_01505 [Saprospiraceae bacterium]|nr:hypothetical protein [Saprospiraceae bacterium]
MSKRLFLLFTGLLCGQLAMTQDDIVVQSISGKALYYASQENTEQNVYPGLRMSSSGKVRCQSGATVKLLQNGEIFTLKGSKLYILSELDPQSKSGSNVGFMGRFSKFLSGSMKETKNEKELEKNHRRYMEKAKAGIGGFSEKTYPIQASLLYQGTLGVSSVTFRWSGAMPGEVCRFQLNRKADGQVIAMALTPDSLFSLDLSQLALDSGAACEWMIVDDKTGAAKSAKTSFVYDPAAASQVLADLRNLKDFQSATPAEQALMKAYSLEEAGLFYDAAMTYAAAAKTYAGNLLVRDTQAAFLSRMGLLDDAKTLLRR